MGSYQRAVITTQGLGYVTQALAGEITLTFSHMAISEYAYPAGTDLSALTSLQGIKMTVEPSSVWVQDSTVGVRGMFSNTSVATEYNIQTVGVYATDGTTEILFSVSSATTPDVMPIYNGVAPSSFIFTVQETISEAASMAITVTTTGVATAQDIADLQASKQDTISGAASTITEEDLAVSRAVVSDASGKIAASTATATEVGYLSGVTSPIQTQIDAKQAAITGGASTISSSNLTGNRALASNASGKVIVSDTTATELGYVHGVTSAIQTQINGKQPTVTGGASTITGSNLTTNRALTSNGSGKVDVSNTTATELGYVHGVTSAIQTQLNGKQATVSGAATTITGSNLTASRALVSNSSGKVAVSAVTSTELGYLDGVTSNVQAQLNNKQATISGGASTITGSNLTANRALISNGSGKVAVSSVTSTELGYLDGATSNIQAQITNLRPSLTRFNEFAANPKSIPNNVLTNAGSYVLSPGWWIIKIAASWDENSAGFRELRISNTETGEPIGFSGVVSQRAVVGERTMQEVVYFMSIGESRTHYIVVWQNSGSALNVYTRINTLKLGTW